jgi:hypothetical protein
VAPSNSVIAVPSAPVAAECSVAFYIAENARRSCHELFSLFTHLRVGQQGVTTDQQQDLLRSMLVFASAGLDATLKQLVRDSLEKVLERNEEADLQFQDFTSKYLKIRTNMDGLGSGAVHIKNLSSILASKNPRNSLIEALKSELTADSLQSVDAVLKVLSNFAVGPADIGLDVKAFKDVFKVRNEIIHEMDVNFQANRSRRQRSKIPMLKSTNNLLDISFKMIQVIDTRILQ